ncbi:MAG TPA: response regulator [Leptolyngbyaceae cyanobacterium]
MNRIAILDDNETWSFALAYVLEQNGFAVSVFSDPSRFLKVANRFDLALIDFSIVPRRYQRDMNGAQVVCEVVEQLDSPPVLVLISAFFIEGVLAEAICPAADTCLSKGMGIHGLIAEVERLLAERQASGKLLAESSVRLRAEVSMQPSMAVTSER